MRSSLRRVRRSVVEVACMAFETKLGQSRVSGPNFRLAGSVRRGRASVVSLRPLIESRRVILCVGCGGVGKTTTAAAVGLAAAASGKRVLCLTIDPARRLAESLGLSEMMTEEQRIDPARLAEAGVPLPGSLTVMMLDTKSTFDDLVARHAPS